MSSEMLRWLAQFQPALLPVDAIASVGVGVL